MSLKRKNTILASLIVGIGLIGAFSWMSAESEKVQSHADEMVVSKSHVAINVTVNTPEGLPSNEDETTKLEAVVQQFPQMGNEPVTYHWNLPEGVEIQTGELSGVILGLNQASATISISVKGLSPETPKNVFLDLNTDMNGQMVGATGVYSTQPTNADLTTSPRQPASKGFFNKSEAEVSRKGLPPKGVHF
jgi:hypothetical protein